jgi:hypothetical protein
MAAFGRLVMNYGVWKGKRLMNEKYLRDATTALANNRTGSSLAADYSAYEEGYGYQIWRVCGGGIAFVGMGDQITVFYPEKDLLFAINSCNQGAKIQRQLIFILLEEMFVEGLQDEPLPEDKAAQEELQTYVSGLKLRSVEGLEDSPLRQQIHGVEYTCSQNPMGITKISFHFNDAKTGEIRYTNKQGDKVLPFGVNHNVYGKFPHLGYAGLHGCVPTSDGSMYDDAVSLAWAEENRVLVYTQIIDRYLGNISWAIGFKDGRIAIEMSKNAEYFLSDYNGRAVGDLA